MSANSPIPVPRTPCVDLATGMPTREWYYYWSQPSLSSASFLEPLTVPNGGTGLSEGVAGGVLAFATPTTLVSSGELQQGRIVFGAGSGLAPSTPVGLGTGTSILVGNAGGYPNWFALEDSGSVQWTFNAVEHTISANVTLSLSVHGSTSINVNLETDGSVTLSLTNVTITSGGTLQKYGFDAQGRLSQQAPATTDDLTEGSTNLYLTQARLMTRISLGF